MERSSSEPPFEGGAQSVPEHQPEVPTRGRWVMQVAIIVIAALVAVAAIAWLALPLLR